MILLRHKDRSSGIFPAEFPALNTWEKLCERQLALDTNENLPDKYKQIVLEINRIHREKICLFFCQMDMERDRDTVFQIKQNLETRLLKHRNRNAEKNDLYWTDYRNTHDPSVYSSGNRR
jgi:DNA-binding helix-hairpin-helix protein with protein kinase domain